MARIAFAAPLMLAAASASSAGNAENGKQKSAVCQQCHGADGNSDNAQFPRLAGQYPDYIVKALADYKSGDRKNPIMAPFAAPLTPSDMEDLAAWFSSRPNGLFVRPW